MRPSSARWVRAATRLKFPRLPPGYPHHVIDSVERLAQIKYLKAEGQAGEQLIEQIDYRYDVAGGRTGKTSLNNNGIGQGETPMSATYDAAIGCVRARVDCDYEQLDRKRGRQKMIFDHAV